MTPRDAYLAEATKAASVYFGRTVPVELVLTKTKAPDVVEARCWVMAYLRYRHGLSFARCARTVGLTDHSTAWTGVRKAHRKWPDAPFVRFSDIGFKLQKLGLGA